MIVYMLRMLKHIYKHVHLVIHILIRMIMLTIIHVYTTQGSMEDWMYASAWDKKGLKRCEGDNPFTSISENGRSEVFLVDQGVWLFADVAESNLCFPFCTKKNSGFD